ncbi:prenyltransferase [Spartinivicinus ruber]|uniref:prenyltransferase n=1 Tax=Spartinivicinus ruber TaxID=2683272 RepID=UPI001E4496C2|nr:prenyltransferase [Spartinivicinus ruber]
MNLKDIIGPIRLPFLILTPICVFLGFGTAAWRIGTENINLFYLFLTLIGAILAHICVNTLNEYHDFKSGLDFKTTRTPFSGGSGTLPNKPELVDLTLIIALSTLVLTVLIGLYFLYIRGLALLPIGIVGLLIVSTYTPWLTRKPLLCLFAPGLGFGPLMVIGTDFMLTGEYSMTAFFASLVPFFLVNNLLLINQFPDAEVDSEIGRKHLPIWIGKRRSSMVYALFIVLTFLSLILGISLEYLPNSSLIGLITLAIAIPVFIGVYRHTEEVTKLIPYMSMNVAINILAPILIAVALLSA